MNKNIYQIASESSILKSILGDPLRFYPSAFNIDDVLYPYAVYSVIHGEPYNFINGYPESDKYIIQIDIFSNEFDIIEKVKKAFQKALELRCYVTRWGNERREADGTFNFNFDIDLIINRID